MLAARALSRAALPALKRQLPSAAGARQVSSRATDHIDFNKTEFRKPDPAKPRIVLAYSGGLDTSTQLAYLADDLGFEVAAYIANLGQDDVVTAEAQAEICAKAKQSGAYCFYNEDLREDFVSNYVFKGVANNCLYEGRYLCGTAIARPCIAKRQTEVAWAEDAKFVSHGSTGKGNDQVRFELCYLGMDPTLDCVTLWRDPEYLAKFQGRQDLIDYATAHGIAVGASKEFSYSEDENIMHISYESGELEDPAYPGNDVEYPGKVLKKKTVDIMDAPDAPANITIHFEAGVPVRVVNKQDGVDVTGALELFSYLNQVGGAHGCGRIDLVENRYVGMKSRGCYETPGASVLFAAHRDLELLTIDREVQRYRDMLAQQAAHLVYNGYWFSPEMQFLQNALDHAQRPVTGAVDVRLHKANIMCRGRSSPHSLYNEDLVSMDVHGGFDATNSTGFIKTLATRLQASAARDQAL